MTTPPPFGGAGAGTTDGGEGAPPAEVKKRQRLEAWRKKQEAKRRQQQQQQQQQPYPQPHAPPPPPPPPPPPVSMSLKKPITIAPLRPRKKLSNGIRPNNSKKNDKNKKKRRRTNAPFGFGDDDDDDGDDADNEYDDGAFDDDDDDDDSTGPAKKKKKQLQLLSLDKDDPFPSVATGTATTSTTTSTATTTATITITANGNSSNNSNAPERADTTASTATATTTATTTKKKRSRWDTKKATTTAPTAPTSITPSSSAVDPNAAGGGAVADELDRFMDRLQAGEMGEIAVSEDLSIQVAGSMMAAAATTTTSRHAVSGGVITAEQLSMFQQQKGQTKGGCKERRGNVDGGASTTDDDDDERVGRSLKQQVRYHPADWMSDASVSAASDNEDNEEQARRALIEALKSAPVPSAVASAAAGGVEEEEGAAAAAGEGTAVPSPASASSPPLQKFELASEVKSEKQRREFVLRRLERAAQEQKELALKQSAPEIGRIFGGDDGDESAVMEEYERLYQVAASETSMDALQVLADLNKKKELSSIDHAQVEYPEMVKNLYRVPPQLLLSNDEIINKRAKLRVRVRGHGAPCPVDTFEQCGISEKILQLLRAQNITKPFPIQAQALPTIMAGRDVIGIGKTGSGKTLAYLLPLLRHVLAQPVPLRPGESGPMGLILAPARELAYQISVVCRHLAKPLGLKSTAVYGGVGVAEQIGDLKRGTHIVVATPGRLIDLLTMGRQAGKVVSFHRVSYVVLDEADRMYDMGFEPQITAILNAIRPDRQTVLFSATFPKAVETLARGTLRYPIEIMVGGRSVASDNITQHAELVEENEKFLRLLQILGEQVEGTKKVIVFVDTQVRADTLFEQLLRNGYPALSLHGGKEQEDRDTTISDFKRKDGPNVLVATGVAGRGLDVADCACVVNYSAPNHLEAYVHQVGRTGRAGNTGVAYTFCNSTEESKYAPIVVRALSEAGQSENIATPLKELSDEFKAKVEKGLAKYAGSGFKGKGYTYDSSEISDAQRMAKIEKRQALIEAGMLDPDDDTDPLLDQAMNKRSEHKNDKRDDDGESNKKTGGDATGGDGKKNKPNEFADLPIEIPENLTPEILALPGMKEALLRKAGIIPKDDPGKKAGAAGAENADETAGATERPIKLGDNHWLYEFEINDYPREARWKVTQRETTSKLQDEYRTAVTLKGSYYPAGKSPGPNDRRLYLHLEAASERSLQSCILEIQRLLNDETLRVSAKQGGIGGGGSSSMGSHKYNVL